MTHRQKNAFLCPKDIVKDGTPADLQRLHLLVADRRSPIIAGRDFRLNPTPITYRKNQQTSPGTRVLNRCAHQRVDQFFQNDLA